MAETIVIGTKVDLDGLKKGEKDIKKSVSDMSGSFTSGRGSVEGFGASLSTLASGAAVAVGAIAGLTVAVGKYTSSQVEMAREIGRVADNANIANEAVSGIATSFLSAGGDIDMASDFVQDFTERLGDAKAGSGALQEAFNELGVNINGTTEQALRQTISTLGTMDDRQRALFRGIELFGDTYKTVAQDIAKGNDLMSGGMFSEEFIDNSSLLKKELNGIKTEFMASANEGLEPFVDGMLGLAQSMREDFMWEWWLGNLSEVVRLGGEAAVALDWMFGGAEARAQAELDAIKEAGELRVREAQRLKDSMAILEQYNQLVEDGQVLLSDQRPKEHRNDLNETYAESIARLTEYTQKLRNQRDGIEEVVGALEDVAVAAESVAWDPSAMENRMIDSMDRIREQARENRLSREQDARDEALNLLAIERDSHVNRKAQRSEARAEEIAEFEEIAHQKQQIAEESARFAFDMGNAFFQASISRDQQELDQWKRTQNDKNSSLIVTSRRRKQIEDQTAKETLQRERDIAKKQGGMQIANAWADSASGIVGIWSSLLGNPMIPKSVAVGLASGYSAMLTGVAGAQTAQIASSMQSFANGGVVQQEAGLPSTGDAHTVRVNPNEEILTADDPRHVNNGGMGGNFTINIGTLTQDTLSELEDNIRALQSAGRTSIDLVS